MKLNSAMKSLLEQYKIDNLHLILQDSSYPIWKKEDAIERKYWCVSNFCGMDKKQIKSTQDLSQLEWDGNEVCLDAYTDEDVADMLKRAIGILLFWKSELQTRYSDTSFYLFASYDNGDMQVLDEGESPVKSITVRFWADRGENTVINLADFDNWDQPAIMEYINCTS